MTPFCDSTMDGFFVARQSDVCPGLVLTQVTTVPIVPYLVRFFASQPMRFKFTIQSSLKRAASRAANVPFLTHIVLDGFVLQKNVLWLRLVVAYFAGINVTLGPLRHVVRPAVSNLLKEGEWVVFGHRFRYFCWRSPVVCRARHNNVLEPPASLSSQPPNNNNWANMCRARRDEALSYNSLHFSRTKNLSVCGHVCQHNIHTRREAEQLLITT